MKITIGKTVCFTRTGFFKRVTIHRDKNTSGAFWVLTLPLIRFGYVVFYT